jgi:hypothetical protein
MTHFPNIDELIELARTNPEELERIRNREIETLITGAPEHLQGRLRGLQFQVDCQRKLHRNPMGACLAISQMMFASVHKLNDILTGDRGTDTSVPAAKKENIIAFPRRAGANS